MTPPKTVPIVSWNYDRNTLLENLSARFVVTSFLISWISSLLSPLIFAISYAKGWNIACATILFISVVSYIPFKSPISLINKFYHYHQMCFFKNTTIESVGEISSDQTFYAVHPHGAYSFGWALLYTLPALQHVKFCFSSVLYASPFFRLFARLTGVAGSADKASMISYLRKGESLALPPGGFEEATITSLNHDRVFIKKRYGFIRLCLKFGIQIKPIYVFGEKDLYFNVQGCWTKRLQLNRLGLPAILVWGEKLSPLTPRRNKNISIVIGAPISIPKIEDPTKEQVLAYHKKYIAALSKLFEDHKVKFYGEEKAKTAKLDIW